MHRRLSLLILLLLPEVAEAHWCDDLWASSYNLALRPEQDTLPVPASGPAQLRVWVDNNMGYPLPGFVLTAQANQYDISVSAGATKVSGFLMPGERLALWLTVTRPNGGTGNLAIEDVTFYVSFGDCPNGRCQDGPYGNGGTSLVIRKTNGDIHPPRDPNNDNSIPGLYPNDTPNQAEHLRAAARADFGNFQQGIAEMYRKYCAGRDSWASDGIASILSHCPDETATDFVTNCPGTTAQGSGYSYTYQHLWPAGELAIRRAHLSARQLATLRDRLICGWADDDFSFKSYITFLLGYLGSDPVAITFLESKAGTVGAAATLPEQHAARAALYLAGSPLFGPPDLDACLVSGDPYAQMVCAAARHLVVGDVAIVEQEILGRIVWEIPDTTPTGMFAAHLINLLAWQERGWQPDAGSPAGASFYDVNPDTTDPQAPTNVQATATACAATRVTWDAVTLDVGGTPETSVSYRVYYGTESNNCRTTCTKPAMGFDYAHVSEPLVTTWFEPDPANLQAGDTYYFAVVAVDRSGNDSVFSNVPSDTVEPSAVAPVPCNPPVAVLNCTPLIGDAPLSVTCDASGSTDPENNIASYTFLIDGTETTGSSAQHTQELTTAGCYSAELVVIDTTNLRSSAEVSIAVADTNNSDPCSLVAVATAAPQTGSAPLEVIFSSADSVIPSGTTVTRSWNFGDGNESNDQNPTHLFAAAGTFNVRLTLSADQRYASDLVQITVTENHPPNLEAASASPVFGDTPLEVQFDASGVVDPDGDDFTVMWDFGQGPPVTDLQTSYTYDTVGTFEVLLRAQDVLGASADRTFVINAGNTPPVVRASVTPSSGRAPLTVTLDASGSSDPDGDDLTVQWTIDGTLSREGPVVEHTFTEPHVYRVVVSVTDDGFPALTTTQELTVTAEGEEEEEGGGHVPNVGGSCGCTTTNETIRMPVFGLRR